MRECCADGDRFACEVDYANDAAGKLKCLNHAPNFCKAVVIRARFAFLPFCIVSFGAFCSLIKLFTR